VHRISQWWRQPDHFHWLSGYLGYRNVRGFTQRMMGSIVVVLGVIPVLMLFSPSGPSSALGWILSGAVAAGCAVMAAVWFTCWPTRGQSRAFSVIAAISIAAVAFTWPNPALGVFGCIVFAALAGYVAFFHSSVYLLFVLAVAAVVAVDCTIEIAARGDVFLAVSAFLICLIGVLAVPFSAQVLVHLLGDDALQSHNDPLTGLRNRRGFYGSVRELVSESTARGHTHLTVAMVDLDRFKTINDTRGHAGGDRLLIDVAANLLRATCESSVVARVGGEEFLIAEASTSDDSVALGERMRSAVATTSGGIVTASVGVACAPLDVAAAPDDGENDTRARVERLVDAADTAMYEAKRAGGDECRHA
jgi:diguanylate cyclase (GGDEF)-like protein